LENTRAFFVIFEQLFPVMGKYPSNPGRSRKCFQLKLTNLERSLFKVPSISVGGEMLA